MNDGDVDVALISAWHGPNGSLVSNDDVADAVNAFPAARNAVLEAACGAWEAQPTNIG
jgi:hypothetical protein